MRRPVRIGVTGGLGAGKSTLVRELARLGCVVFSADDVVHELYASNDELQKAVRERWGDRVCTADGSINRAAIAEIVFADANERAWLESIVHPLVAAAWLQCVAQADAAAAIVAEVPLLFEAGLEDRYDLTVLVTADEATRMERVRDRNHGGSHASARIAAQWSDVQRSERAHLVIRNDGSEAALSAAAQQVLDAAHAITQS